MSQNIKDSIKQKISEDISPTKNLSGLHLKIVAAIAIIWSLFQLWYASPFPFIFNLNDHFYMLLLLHIELVH